MDDVYIFAMSESQKVVCDIKDYFYGRCLDMTDGIYRHDFVDEMLTHLQASNLNTYNCFTFLKQNDYINVCGRGYLFNDLKIDITKEQHERLTDLIWNTDIFI